MIEKLFSVGKHEFDQQRNYVIFTEGVIRVRKNNAYVDTRKQEYAVERRNSDGSFDYSPWKSRAVGCAIAAVLGSPLAFLAVGAAARLCEYLLEK
ncbi:MAG TPA: hypothetical protein VJJ82_00635 [Candidatus Nanoarchaeia archaeon]|nr:hypothetical protein [Candidatus Nanoarchaeia archaeon]